MSSRATPAAPIASLAKTAIAFDASGLDQAQPVRIRVYVFRDRDTWQRLSASVPRAPGHDMSARPGDLRVVQHPRRTSSRARDRGRRASRSRLKSAFTTAAGNGD